MWHSYKPQKPEKPKNAKKEFLALLLMGIAIILITTTCFLVFYRPFVNWKKFVCSEEDGTMIREYNPTNVTYRYEIDGIWYEKRLTGIGSTTHEKSDGMYFTIYVNADNPHDVKRGAFGKPLLYASIGFELLGIILIWFGFHQKKNIEKKQGIYKKKLKKENNYLKK